MSQAAHLDPDPSRPWVYWVGDCCIPLPKAPMINAGLGPPPFEVRLWNGEVRHVRYAPDDFEQRRGA